MSLNDVVLAAISLLMAAVGLSLFGVGAYGSLRVRLLNMDHTFTAKQRIQFTLFGLLLLAIAATQFAGLAGEL